MSKTKKGEATLAASLGNQIRVRRAALRLTQEALAERVGVEVNTISRIECGTHSPSIRRLESIAQALAVSIGVLLGTASPLKEDQVVRLHSILAGLDSAERDFILSFAEQQAMFFRNRRLGT